MTKTSLKIQHPVLAELSWLESVILRKIELMETGIAISAPLPAPVCDSQNSHYAKLIRQHDLSVAERVVLALSIVPHLRPELLDKFAASKQLMIASKVHRSKEDISLLPTAQTALFLIDVEDESERFDHLQIFETEHIFYRDSVIQLGAVSAGASPLDGILILNPHFRDLLIHDRVRPPRFSTEFPAHLLTTTLDWDDLILMPSTLETLSDVKITLKQADKLRDEWNMGKIIRPGCRILLYGDSGQGKTLTASLLGKYLDRQVYRVDIAGSVSKYVGETNQRLEALFNTAENKNWILFFDEGDALLGQRQQAGGQSTSSHYANQEVAYLLQRIETFNGIIIVATNLRSNIDYAFQRRFDAAAQFKALDPAHQQKVWMRFWPSQYIERPSEHELMQITQRHTLSPASIVNVIRRIAAHVAERNVNTLPEGMLQKFVQDEEYKFKGAAGFAH
jgi:hypothetical protein